MAEALEGMMALYHELFDLDFRKAESPSVWHESVEMYDVVSDGVVTGRFYLDLCPREGKESHIRSAKFASRSMTSIPCSLQKKSKIGANSKQLAPPPHP
jgi:thimet oligopeptidase